MTSRNRARSPKLDVETASKIKYLWNNTNMNQAQIASRLGALNQGRVSEVISRHRFPNVPPAMGL
jgi:predicted XRE-type DNA-binding protein